MNNGTTKFNNTAVLMQQALFRLLNKKDFNKINVTEICKVAGVNRSTFYDHYQNTYDLLQEAIDASIKEFVVKLEQSNLNYKEAMNEDSNFLATPKYLVPYLEYIRKNKVMFRAYMGNLNVCSANDYNEMLIKNIFIPIYKKNGIFDESIIRYMSQYFLAGVNAIVSEWVANNCKDDILFIVEIITLCIRPKQLN